MHVCQCFWWHCWLHLVHMRYICWHSCVISAHELIAYVTFEGHLSFWHIHGNDMCSVYCNMLCFGIFMQTVGSIFLFCVMALWHICYVSAIHVQWGVKCVSIDLGVRTWYTCMHTYMHTCMHTYTWIHIYTYRIMHVCLHTSLNVYIHICMHACSHTYIHTSIQTYIHTSH